MLDELATLVACACRAALAGNLVYDSDPGPRLSSLL